MSERARSRHEEWLDELEPRVRAEVEDEIASYKPAGGWQFEETEPEDDREPSDGTGQKPNLNSGESGTNTVAAAD